MSYRVPDDFKSRVQFAASFIASGRSTNRSFDSCFEMGDGDAVCLALVRRVRKRPTSKLAENLFRYVCRESVERVELEHSEDNPETLSAIAISAIKSRARRLERFSNLAAKCRDNRDATRLWNLADCWSDSETYWRILANVCPWAFHDPKQVNSIKFTY